MQINAKVGANMAISDAPRQLESGESIFVDEVVLKETYSSWPFADRHRSEIETHWSDACARNPHIFNGTIYPLIECEIAGNGFHGHYAKSDFASYLYWRDKGFCDAPTCDGFGSVLLRSAEGRFLFAKAAGHTLNAGKWVPPGGMIDQRDVDDAGVIDIWSSGLRELAEETGLSVHDVVIDPGFQIARDGALIAIGLSCQAKLSEAALVERFHKHNDDLGEGRELDDVLWLSVDDALQSDAVPRFVKLLLNCQRGGIHR